MAEMTPQKALEILEMFLHKQCNLQRTEFAYSDIEVYCAVSMAKNALEKQIPKKPIRGNRIIKKDGSLFLNDGNEYWKCPICTEYDVPLLENQEYCHCCGQALDWSDTE